MGKGSFIAIVALLIAVAGAIVAFAAYFKHRNCSLCEDLDDMVDDDSEMSDLDYYATQLDDDEDDYDLPDEAPSCASVDDCAAPKNED